MFHEVVASTLCNEGLTSCPIDGLDPAFEGRGLGDKEHIPFFLNKMLDCVLPRTPITANRIDMAGRLRYRGLS